MKRFHDRISALKASAEERGFVLNPEILNMIFQEADLETVTSFIDGLEPSDSRNWHVEELRPQVAGLLEQGHTAFKRFWQQQVPLPMDTELVGRLKFEMLSHSQDRINEVLDQSGLDNLKRANLLKNIRKQIETDKWNFNAKT